MIENQTIPLRRLLDLLNTETKVINLVLTPEDCIGDLERSWLERGHQGSEILTNIIESSLMERRAEAMKHFDKAAEGMQFYLPPPDSLRPFAQRIAQAICNLPPVSDEEPFRTALSQIFGAAVQIVAEKPDRASHRSNRTLKNGFEEKDGITYALDDRIRRILLHDCSLLPDVQAADENEIANFFPSDCWQYCVRVVGEGSPIITLGLISQPGRLNIPGCQHQLLFVLRYSCSVPEHSHVRVQIRYLDRQLYVEQIWQEGSYLWVALLPSSSNTIVLDLLREVIAPNGECELDSEGLEVAFIGAFQIE